MPEGFICKQCGSTSFEELGTNQITCAHCGSMYKKSSDQPAVIVGKGANVIVGKKGNVEIKGKLEIKEGARIDIQGKVVIKDKNKDTKSKYPNNDEEESV